MVAHCAYQADLRIKTEVRKRLVETIRMFFYVRSNNQLKMFGVKQKHLGTYTTQESDLFKGISRIPLSLALIDT